MSAAIDLINKALFKLGVHSEIKPVSSEMRSVAFKSFQGFIKALKDQGYDETGVVVPGVTADEVSERGGASDIIATLFAVHVAPDFRKPPPPDLVAAASLAEEKLERHYRKLDVPSNTPSKPRVLGQGNRNRLRGSYF